MKPKRIRIGKITKSKMYEFDEANFKARFWLAPMRSKWVVNMGDLQAPGGSPGSEWAEVKEFAKKLAAAIKYMEAACKKANAKGRAKRKAAKPKPKTFLYDVILRDGTNVELRAATGAQAIKRARSGFGRHVGMYAGRFERDRASRC